MGAAGLDAAGGTDGDCNTVTGAAVVVAAGGETTCGTVTGWATGETEGGEAVGDRVKDAAVPEPVCRGFVGTTGAALESGIAGCIGKPFFGLIGRTPCLCDGFRPGSIEAAPPCIESVAPATGMADAPPSDFPGNAEEFASSP